MNSRNKITGRTLGVPLTVLSLVPTLTGQESTSLIVKGQEGTAKVVQVQGRNYVDVDGLARIMNSTISFQGSQIVLTLPGTGNAPIDSSQATGFSRGFLTAGVEGMARFREWHTALRTAVERGVPLNTGWLSDYEAKARESLKLASVAVTTDSDRGAYQLAVNFFNNMKTLTDKYMQLSNSQTYFARDSLQSDPLEQSIVACGRSLAAMAAAKQFVDDGSCQ